METDIGREESLNGTKERAFTLIGDPGDEAGENLLPTKQPPNLFPLRMVWDQKKHVYYMLYSDLRLLKMFRHVFIRDIEDTFITGKLWPSDVIDMTLGDNCLYILCREWAMNKDSALKKLTNQKTIPASASASESESIGSDGNIANMVAEGAENETSSSSSESPVPRKSFDPVLKHFICIVDKRSLSKLGEVAIPSLLYDQKGAFTNKWHMAAHESDLLLYVDHGEKVFHFEDGKYSGELETEQFHKRSETSVNDFQLRGSLLYIGTNDNVLSIYDWKSYSPNCKVIIKIPDAKDGNFTLLGKFLAVTRSIQKLPTDSSFDEDEQTDVWKKSMVTGQEIEYLRYVDVGTKDTFRKPINLRDFKIFTAASNGKLVLYKMLSKELVYQNL